MLDVTEKKKIEQKITHRANHDFLTDLPNRTHFLSETVNKIIEANFDKKKLHLISVHGMSSMKYSPNSDCGTNHYGKLNNYENIFINDASIVPSNTGESPQATIMAFAKFVSKNL